MRVILFVSCEFLPNLQNPASQAIFLMVFIDREENERRVKQVLVELGEDLRIAAEKEVEGLPLPMRDTEIERFCKQAKSSVLQRFAIKFSLCSLLFSYFIRLHWWIHLQFLSAVTFTVQNLKLLEIVLL